MFDFSKAPSRYHTNSRKWDGYQEKGYALDILPMWVADMDFPTVPEVTQMLAKRITEHPIYGYSFVPDSCREATCGWMERHHGYRPDTAWFVHTPGVVAAVKTAVQTFTSENDGILIQTPVYYPFKISIESNGRRAVENPLVLRDGKYQIDFADLEEKAARPDVTMLIFCNPHNPVGRIFTKEEVQKVAEICRKNHVFVVSDEIHQDFMLPGHPHTPFLTLGEEYYSSCIVCTAPSKTFNLAGMQMSDILIPDADNKAKFQATMGKNGLGGINVFAPVATEAAYTYGDQWFAELMAAVEENIRTLREELAAKIPGAKMIEPEGLYLTWVDFSCFGLEGKALDDFFLHDAKVWLDDGPLFGTQGKGYQRFNLACPKSVVVEAVDRIAKAAKEKGLL